LQKEIKTDLGEEFKEGSLLSSEWNGKIHPYNLIRNAARA
jgi:hypothetical protein